MAEFSFEVTSDTPNIRHEIHFQGDDFHLVLEGGVWFLESQQSLAVRTHIGRRKRWQDALRDSLIFIQRLER